jgi:hypothetical protein
MRSIQVFAGHSGRLREWKKAAQANAPAVVPALTLMRDTLESINDAPQEACAVGSISKAPCVREGQRSLVSYPFDKRKFPFRSSRCGGSG